MKEETKALDQFYTNPKIIKDLIKKVEKIAIGKNFLDPLKIEWFEPSAGSGNFIDELVEYYGPKVKIEAYDLAPKSHPLIKKANYLELDKKHSSKRIVIGNPPFGKRAKLAVDFINKSAEHADIIAFILPNQLHRYLTQKNINDNLKLIHQSDIDKNSFLVDDRAYNVNCVFQIWVKKDKEHLKSKRDIRKYEQPQRTHDDFELMIHNNTQGTLKYFDKKKYKWTFAIHRQGYYDYNDLKIKEEDLIKNRQYLFVKCNNKICKDIVKEMDKDKLTKWSTSTPGFSNEDFVTEYLKLRKEKKDE